MLGEIGGIVGYFGVGMAYDRFEMFRNKKNTSGKHRAKVLINYSYWMEFNCIAFTGYRSHIARRLTELDIKADWKYKASSKDLEHAINNPDYQSIVVLGHGDRHKWHAKDKVVDTWMFANIKPDNLKDGFWFQYTCSTNNRTIPLGYYVMKDQSKILGYEKKLTSWDMFFEEPHVLLKLNSD